MVGKMNGVNNHEGALTPQRSQWGQALIAGIPQLTDMPMPIGKRVDSRKPYGGTVGGVGTNVASTLTVSSTGGYWGDLPQTQQEIVQASDPWNRD